VAARSPRPVIHIYSRLPDVDGLQDNILDMTLTGAQYENSHESSLPEKERLSLEESQKSSSHGRGGAGNFGVGDVDKGKEDYTLPVIKSAVYTTARGGSGNMQRNDFEHPEIARASQDVELTPRRPSETEFHGARGGAGNVFTPSEEELAAAQRERFERSGLALIKQSGDRNGPIDHNSMDYRGWADKGKEAILSRFSIRRK